MDILGDFEEMIPGMETILSFYGLYKFGQKIINLEALHKKKEANRLAKQLVQRIKATIDAVECSNMMMWHGHRLSTWLHQLHDLALDVEDFVDIDEFTDKIKGKRKFSEFIFGDQLSFLFQVMKTVINFVHSENRMEKLDVLGDRFHKILSATNSFMNLLDNGAKTQSEITKSYSPCVTNFVGRANEKDELITLFREIENNRVEVITLTGIGGVGKTALAQNMYNEVNDFDLLGWAPLSDSSNLRITLFKLLEIFGQTNLPENITLKNAFNILSQTVHGKRFFLVLDDVKNTVEDQCKDLIVAMRSGAQGSKILITTQSHNIARRIGTVKPIHLDVLEPEALLELFQHHAFSGVDIDEGEARILISMSRKISANLCGLPLAAKIIGNMLRSNLNENEWRRVSELQWWNIKEALDGILPSLIAGYQQLEAGQRKCFAYCCIFPKNHCFQKEKLVQMWIANDFIPSNDQEMVTMEFIGRHWFDDLVEKSFIQQSGDNGQFTVSDLMRSLAAIVSARHQFSLTQESSTPSALRHLALPAGKLEELCGIEKPSKLRTIILSGSEINNMNMLTTIFSKLDRLLVLQLSGIHMQHLPNSIWYLSHLRYLDLSFTEIRDLPPSIQYCYHLQVLDLRGCHFESLPAGITNLINLRHLYADSRIISLITGIGKLTNLQELNVFHVRKERGYKITELKNMRMLSGELRIMDIENVSNEEEAREAKLIEKKSLDMLGLYQEPSNRPDSREILQALKPHPELKELVFNGYEGSSLPDWFQELISIQKITVERCPNLVSMAGIPPILHE